MYYGENNAKIIVRRWYKNYIDWAGKYLSQSKAQRYVTFV